MIAVVVIRIRASLKKRAGKVRRCPMPWLLRSRNKFVTEARDLPLIVLNRTWSCRGLSWGWASPRRLGTVRPA